MTGSVSIFGLFPAPSSAAPALAVTAPTIAAPTTTSPPKRKTSRRAPPKTPLTQPLSQAKSSQHHVKEIVIQLTEQVDPMAAAPSLPPPCALGSNRVEKEDDDDAAPGSISPSRAPVRLPPLGAGLSSLSSRPSAEVPGLPLQERLGQPRRQHRQVRSETATSLAQVSAAPLQSRGASPALTDAATLTSGTATLVRSNSDALRSGRVAGASAIRSIFPRYDPTVPLQHQNYRPTQPSPKHIPREHISKEAYSPTLYSAGSSGRACLSAPSTVTSFPAGVLNAHHRPRYSSRDELADLWEAANGQGTLETGKTFALKMSREGSINPTTGVFVPTPGEAFTFGPSQEQPFYDFQTIKPHHDHLDPEYSECHIRRRDPTRGTIVPVVTFTLEPAARRTSPQDGLVTDIYPKIAAMMALDGAARLNQHQQQQRQQPHQHHSPSDASSERISDDAAALRRAAQRETCKLFWDHDSRRYYLLHPGLNHGRGQRFVVLMTDPRGASIDACGSSPPSVPSTAAVGFDVARARGTIRLVHGTSHATLASLEFGTGAVLIDTRATAAVPSFYMVDIAVSALIAVALLEGRNARAVMAAAGLCRPLDAGGAEAGADADADAAPRSRSQPLVRGPLHDDDSSPPLRTPGLWMVLFDAVVWLVSAVLGAGAALLVAVSGCVMGGKEGGGSSATGKDGVLG
ncbi:MAG: hypothetical protein M1826_003826 [Phylliscum demangeonii]|nr:MAG: hypothetical protein M1826_003826 [Phylliscum demangeonii]